MEAAPLARLVHRESSTLLRYTIDATPWVDIKQQADLDGVLASARAEVDALAKVSRYLIKHKLARPTSGHYPEWFTTLNFLAFTALLPKLVADQNKHIGELEKTAYELPASEVRDLVWSLVELKKRHLQQLTELVSGKPATPSAYGHPEI